MNAADLPDETLFEGALKCRTPTERAAYLDRVCAGQPELRRKLEILLEAHDRAGEFLEAAPAGPHGAVKLDLAPEEAPGTMIGRYKLLQKIGEGGMGVVYMAEQTDPVVRKVALKIIKLGMDTRQVVARFEAERQALALMDHPNIAKVLDGGAAETGRPYFVMELVHGAPITEYCDKNKLSTRRRLELFIPVCQAIQHAHQKGIIHRDIKPSNVMVTLHDGAPVPKVIDFGVAKATNQRLTEKTLFTNYAQMIGTPAYMSPEQAEMSGLDIDTRSDIYSLGVLLYELLTGTTPFDAKELLSKGYAEMQRIIAQEEPAKPSTRMSTLTDEQRTVVATHRNTDASALRKVLQGDLDWIVMKCLEKDRTRRYETSNGLAADLRRHLTNELISARAPTAGYLLKKLIKRNKTAVATAAVVAASLIIGVVATTRQAILAKRAEQRARKAESLAKERLDESEALSAFLTGLLQSPDPARDGRSITVAEILDKAASKLDSDFAAQPARRTQMQATLAKTYMGLGLSSPAIPLLEKARDASRETAGPEHPDTLAIQTRLGNAYHIAGRRAEALKLREELLTISRRLFGPTNSGTLTAMLNLSASYQEAGRRQEALALVQETLEQRRVLNGPEHIDTLSAQENLAVFYFDAGRWRDALPLQEELLTLRRRIRGPEHPDTIMAMNNLALTYADAGRQADALKLRETVLELSRRISGPEHPDTLLAMHGLALSYMADPARVSDGIRLQEEALALRRKVSGPRHPETLKAMLNLGMYYFQNGRVREGLPLQEELLQLSRAELGPENPETLKAMNNLAICYAKLGRTNEALALHEQVVPVRRRVLGTNHLDTLGSMHELARCYYRAGRNDEASRLWQEALPLLRERVGMAHRMTMETQTLLAHTLMQAGRFEEAIPLWNAYLQSDADGRKLGSNVLAWAESRLGTSLANVGLPDEAIPHWQKAIQTTPGAPSLASTYYDLAKALMGRSRFAEALPVLEIAQKLHPESPRSARIADWLRMAKEHSQSGQSP